MQCFYHPSVLSIGTCKYCQKGLCKKCARTIGEALSCKGACEKRVAVLNEAVAEEEKPEIDARTALRRNAILYLVYAGLFLLGAGGSLTLSQSEAGKVAGYVCLGSAAALLCGAAYTWSTARRIPPEVDRET